MEPTSTGPVCNQLLIRRKSGVWLSVDERSHRTLNTIRMDMLRFTWWVKMKNRQRTMCSAHNDLLTAGWLPGNRRQLCPEVIWGQKMLAKTQQTTDQQVLRIQLAVQLCMMKIAHPTAIMRRRPAWHSNTRIIIVFVILLISIISGAQKLLSFANDRPTIDEDK